MNEQHSIDKLQIATDQREIVVENKTPSSEARRLLAEALSEGRIKVPEGFEVEKTELVVVVPVFAEWANGNFLKLLQNFANQDEGGVVLVIALNSTVSADKKYQQENVNVQKMLEFIWGERFNIPQEDDIPSSQLADLNQLRAVLKSRLVLMNLNAQLDQRDLAAVRTAGTILGSALAKSPETPIAWLDCDTQVTGGYTRQISSYYEKLNCDALFLNLNYEPSDADESLANTTLEYQFSVAKSYLQMYWRKFAGKGNSIGLGGPVITAKADVFISALEKLQYLELDGKGGGEDYGVTKILNQEQNCHFSNTISVRTSDRRRPQEVGFDSADRAKGLYAGSVGEPLRWPTLSSMVRTDVLSGAIESIPDWIDNSVIEKLRSVIELVQLDSQVVFSQLAETILADADGLWGDYDTGQRFCALLVQDTVSSEKILLSENLRRRLAQELITVVSNQSDAMSASVTEYGNDLDNLFSGLLGQDNELERFSQLKSDEIIRIETEVSSRIAQLRQLFAEVKGGQLETSTSIASDFPFTYEYLAQARDVQDFLMKMALAVPDLFSQTDAQAVARRKALATVRAATKMFGEALSTSDYLDTYSPLQTCRWNVGKGITTQEEFKTIASMQNIATELVDLRIVRKMDRNELGLTKAFDVNGNQLGTFTAFNDRIEISDVGMISEADDQLQTRVENWKNLGFEGITIQLLSKTDEERKLVLRWQDFTTDTVVKSMV